MSVMRDGARADDRRAPPPCRARRSSPGRRGGSGGRSRWAWPAMAGRSQSITTARTMPAPRSSARSPLRAPAPSRSPQTRAGRGAERLVADAAAALGPLGCLVNNASVFERDEALTATRESWDRHIATNLRAPFVLMQHFARQLPPECGGTIVNLLDERVWNLTPHFISYSLSKAGLWTLTRPWPWPSPRASGSTASAPARPCRARARARRSSAGNARRCRWGTAPRPRRSQPQCASSWPRRRDRADDRPRWRPASGLGAPGADSPRSSSHAAPFQVLSRGTFTGFPARRRLHLSTGGKATVAT